MRRGRRRKRPPYKTIGLVALMVMVFACPGLYLQFRGEFTPKAKSTLVAARAGLVMDPGSKVTYNGVEIGRVSNLPRTNANGGRPGCWQTITRELWPAPYLVMDDGASIAPYNHLDVGSPLVVEYVWGRQLGDNTIKP
jgi:hypothetical protein